MTELRAPILLLDPEAASDKGNNHIAANIEAAQSLGDFLSSTLGPSGHDKVLVLNAPNATRPTEFAVSNDGAFILSKLLISHPAAEIVKQISLAQDAVSGDNTTTACLLLCKLLENLKALVLKRVAPRKVAAALARTEKVLLKECDRLSAKTLPKTGDCRQLAKEVARSALASKLLADSAGFFADLVQTAVVAAEQKVFFCPVVGSNVKDSFCFRGAVFPKKFSYAGFEALPKKLDKPRVACLEIELELRSEKDTAELRLASADAYQQAVDAEYKLFFDRLEALVVAGARVVLSSMPVGDLATQFFAKCGVFCAGRLKKEELVAVADVTGAKPIRRIELLDEKLTGFFGQAVSFEERLLAGKRYNFVEATTAASTLVLRGGSKRFLEEAQRALEDAAKVFRLVLRSGGKLLAGAGATEVALSRRLAGLDCLETFESSELAENKAVLMAFAGAFDFVVQTLADNAGLDGLDLLGRVKKAQENADLAEEGTKGLCLDSGTVKDAVADLLVLEPLCAKKSLIKAVVEGACLVLSIGATVKDRPSQRMD